MQAEPIMAEYTGDGTKNRLIKSDAAPRPQGLVNSDNPILRKLAEPVTEPPARVMHIINKMMAVLKDSDGLGVAAPQVGVSKQIILVRLSGREITCMINPKIRVRKGRVIHAEQCLSLPGIIRDVPRAKQIKMLYTNIHGVAGIPVKFNDLDAAIIQHEIDHLDGVLITDYYVH